MITQEIVRQQFDYDPEDGKLIRRKTGNKPSWTGGLPINGKHYEYQRVVFL